MKIKRRCYVAVISTFRMASEWGGTRRTINRGTKIWHVTSPVNRFATYLTHKNIRGSALPSVGYRKATKIRSLASALSACPKKKTAAHLTRPATRQPLNRAVRVAGALRPVGDQVHRAVVRRSGGFVWSSGHDCVGSSRHPMRGTRGKAA